MCQMAAGQQKKRLNAASHVSCNLQDQYRAKKKRSMESSEHGLNMRSHISLEWDTTQKKAMAKEEQIGITWTDIAPFINSARKSNTGLADVIPIPRDIFGLEDLTGVLSYEVWEKLLSGPERRLLAQFLPRGSDVDQVLQALLMGDNLHFGNSFLRWGASLCSGNLHPDAVLMREKGCKAKKKAYYLELQKYHNDIIRNLQTWKDMWTRNKDPEKDIVEEMWRKRFVKHKKKGSLVASERAKLAPISREEMPHQHYSYSGNSDTHTPYLQVCRSQHQLVKKIKQGDNSIQSRSLNHMFGEVKSLYVNSHEVFEEEEKKKLQEHWLLVSRRDIPAAFQDWKERKLQRQQCRKFLEQEMKEMKETSTNEGEDKEKPENYSFQEQGCNGEIDVQNHEVDGRVAPARSTHHSKPLQQMHQEDGLIFMDSDNCNKEMRHRDTSVSHLQFQENWYPIENDVELGAPDDSATEVWQTDSAPDSYFHATNSMIHEYASSGELLRGNPQPTEELPAQLIDLETELLEQETAETLLPELSNQVGPCGAPFFSCYANRDCNKLIPTFTNGQGSLQSYPHESMNSLIQPGLRFLRRNGDSHNIARFPHQFQDQHQRLLEQQQIIEKKLYMHQAMQKNMYSSGRYRTQELFSPMDVQDLEADSIHEAPFQSANGRMSGPNWFSKENPASNGWSGLEVSLPNRHGVGRDSRNTDGLFGALSHSNSLQSRSLYGSMNAGQFIPVTDFMGQGISSSGDILAYSSQQLGYLNAQEAATATVTAALKANNTSWMVNSPHLNPVPRNLIETPFLRAWNQ